MKFCRDFPLFLALGFSAIVQAQQPVAANVAGDWRGALEAGGTSLPLVFHIKAAPDGLAATLDSPAQGANGIPVTAAVLGADGTLSLQIAAVHGGFTGKLSQDGAELDGQWQQGGGSLPLKLKRSTDAAALAEPRRPQTPHAPFPYRSEDVSVPAAGNTLAATLTLPAGKGPFPAVLLIAGSGAHDRDETILGHKLFLVLADFLTRRGIAVLRADKRGVGKSTGSYAQATSADFAADAEAALAYLRTRSEVDSARVGLIGHSEGGLIAPMVAAHDPAAVAAMVLLAGPGVSGLEILVAQTRLLTQASGASADAARIAADQERVLLNIAVQEKDPALRDKKLHDALLADGLPEDKIAGSIRPITSPWYLSFLASDPTVWLSKVRCPVLALGGSRDLQVPAQENLAAIRASLASGGNTHVTTELLPGLNHLFQPATTGLPNEYGQIETTISPAVLDKIGSWLAAQPALATVAP